MILGRSALARYLGVTRQTVYQYQKEGKIPGPENGGSDPDVVKKNLAEKLGTKRGGLPRTGERSVAPPGMKRGTERTRADYEREVWRERAIKLQIENAVRTGKLVDRNTVESAIEARFRAESEALLNWPPRVSAEMAAELNLSEREVAIVLNRYVRQFMDERSRTKTVVTDEKEQRSWK